MKAKKTILTLMLIALVGTLAVSQTKDEGKIVIEITKDVNGEKKTFKGEYNSTEEMHADPAYKEFAGEESGFNFWLDNDDEGPNVFLRLHQLGEHTGSAFKFFHDDEEDDDDGKHSFFFKHFDGDSTENFFDLNLDGTDMEEYKEKMKELGIELEVLMNKLHEDSDDRSISVITFKSIKITDVENEFGKKGKVDESNVLELEDLVFYPNPSPNGRFKVKFNVPEEGELSIKVSNLEGKEVFSRYFERFGGTYSEMIDLSGQKEGIYLLEIEQGKKRLTKKIVIN
ncbi:MAG: T9SS type A sorting domain-containing protein [Ekhidna sp.]